MGFLLWTNLSYSLKMSMLEQKLQSWLTLQVQVNAKQASIWTAVFQKSPFYSITWTESGNWIVLEHPNKFPFSEDDSLGQTAETWRKIWCSTGKLFLKEANIKPLEPHINLKRILVYAKGAIGVTPPQKTTSLTKLSLSALWLHLFLNGTVVKAVWHYIIHQIIICLTLTIVRTYSDSTAQ